MNLIITESQYKLLVENIEGLDTFKSKAITSYPEIEDFWDVIDNFIRNSEVKKIEVKNIQYGVAASLINGVIFGEGVFKLPVEHFLFTLFHEIAHQYQFKKYGKEKMMELYDDIFSVEDAAKMMREIELVADEFATRKLREIQNYGYLEGKNIPKGFYKLSPLSQFEFTVKMLKSKIKESGLTNVDDISDLLYNWLKTKV